LQASPPDGSVTISTMIDQAAQCEISFSDTVLGIDAATLERVFESFYTTK